LVAVVAKRLLGEMRARRLNHHSVRHVVGSHVAPHIDLARPASSGLSHDDDTKISLRPVSFSSAGCGHGLLSYALMTSEKPGEEFVQLAALGWV
jgi:hypothetical protein